MMEKGSIEEALERCYQISHETLDQEMVYHHLCSIILKPFYEIISYHLEKPNLDIPQYLVSSFGKVKADYALTQGNQLIDGIEKSLNEALSNIDFSGFNGSNDEGTLLFYLAQNDDLSFRSSFMCELRFDLVIALSSNGYNKIIDALKNGKTLTTYIPFKNEDKKLVNIQGIIEGSDQSLAPLILTAHFDHLGSDSQNNIYYGALDNASGTSFLLELANTLSTFGKPKRSIIFVALNAEELGLKGSNFFAENNYFDIKNSKVINFDMIGVENCPITFIQGVGFKDNSSNILNSLSNICLNDSVDYLVEYENSSDHASFNELGIDALTICHSDKSHIHTPTDTVDYIDSNAINTVYKVVNKEIKKDCYSTVTTFIYSRKSINLFLIILLALIIIGILNTKPFKKAK